MFCFRVLWSCKHVCGVCLHMFPVKHSVQCIFACVHMQDFRNRDHQVTADHAWFLAWTVQVCGWENLLPAYLGKTFFIVLCVLKTNSVPQLHWQVSDVFYSSEDRTIRNTDLHHIHFLKPPLRYAIITTECGENQKFYIACTRWRPPPQILPHCNWMGWTWNQRASHKQNFRTDAY